MHTCSFGPQILKPAMCLVTLGLVSILLFQESWGAKEDGNLAGRVPSEREVQLGHGESTGISDGTSVGAAEATPAPRLSFSRTWAHKPCVVSSFVMVTVVSQPRTDSIAESIDPVAGLLVLLEAHYKAKCLLDDSVPIV